MKHRSSGSFSSKSPSWGQTVCAVHPHRWLRKSPMRGKTASTESLNSLEAAAKGETKSQGLKRGLGVSVGYFISHRVITAP